MAVLQRFSVVPLGWFGLAGLVLIVSTIGACGEDPVAVDPNLPRDTQWQEDLAFLARQLEDLHPDLYHSINQSAWDAARIRLHETIPDLTDEEIFVELLRLVTLTAKQRDGHTALSYFEGTGFGIVPLQFYRFADGVFVVDAGPEHAHLVGRQLVGVEGHTLDEIDRLVDPLIPRDNESSLIGYRNLAYVTPNILAVLGVVADPEAPVYRFAVDAGETLESVTPVPPDQYGLESIFNLPTPPDAPLYLTRRDEDFWLVHLDSDNLLYVRINAVRPTSGGEDLGSFGARALAIIDAGGVDRVIVDLRQNNGGNNQLIASILEVLTDPRVNRADRLLVFTDRHTFSAAGNLVAAIAAETSARFVGISPGGSGSQFGDVERVELPYSGIAAFIPTRHWIFGDPTFQPLAHPMDVTVEPTAADFFARVDPVLDRYISG